MRRGKKVTSIILAACLICGMPLTFNGEKAVAAQMPETEIMEETTEEVPAEEPVEETTEEPSVEGEGIVSYGESDEPMDTEGIHFSLDAEPLQEASEMVLTAPGNLIALDSAYAKQDNLRDEIFYCKGKDGLYFLYIDGDSYSNRLDYSLAYYDGSQYQKIYGIQDTVCDAYRTEDAIYSVYEKITSLSEPVTYQGKECSYTDTFTVKRFDLLRQQETTMTLDPVYVDAYWSGYVSTIGVDNQGRVYIATAEDQILLFNAEGKFLSSCKVENTIYDFVGFDSVNGNFYYTGNENWRYWGFDHAMTALKAGNVSADGTISVTDKNISMLYQSYFFERRRSVQMLTGQYLGILNTFSGNVLYLLDSNSYDYRDYSEQETTIDIMNGGAVSVSAINISNRDAIKLAVSTSPSKYEDNRDTTSAGTRGVVSGDDLYVKTDTNTITQFSISGKKELISLKTQYPVYDLYADGNTVIAILKNDSTYYMQKIDWSIPKDYSATLPSAMKAGETATIICDNGTAFQFDYTYESSDSSIVSVDDKGNLTAWKAGTATITITDAQNGISKNYGITVSSGTGGNGTYTLKSVKGTKSTTIHLPYAGGNYGTTTNAYLNQLNNGNYERVEWVNRKVIVETFDAATGTLKGQKTITPELNLFGGYYKGSGYQYLVFGQQNTAESDDTEVIRVVKYDENWNRVAACSIKGANTYIPFDAGGLDMVETGGILYIHTCHEMYQSSDGYHHQANATFAINEADMTLKDSYTGVMNLSEGYVSHSFNQRICTDGTNIYRVDLGDAYPRGITYTKTPVTNALSNPTMYGSVRDIAGDIGDNYTGYDLGGVELGKNNIVITGAGLNNNAQNIWVTALTNASGSYKGSWLTDYNEGENIRLGVPKLVKLFENGFMIMWEEYSKKNYQSTYTTTKYALLNEDGTLASKIYSMPLALSKCDPIVNAKGNVCWYVTEDSAPVFVEVNPYALEQTAQASAAETTFTGNTSGGTGGNTGGNTGDTKDTSDDGGTGAMEVDGLTMSGVAHVQTFGNKNGTYEDGTLTLGTTGLAKRLESITINLKNATGLSGGVSYRVHRQTYGWTNWVINGQPAGTTGQGKRLEAIQLKLTGELAEQYSIRYRVHIQTYGWKQGWQYDGALAGTTGEAKRLEALEIQIVPKTVDMGVSYRVHRQTYGWETVWAKNGGTSGTVGEAKRLEGITLALTGNEYSGSIVYTTHVQKNGWMDEVSDGWMSGTSGEAKRLEAIKIRLTGEVAEHYDVYYRVHAQTYGWLGWAKNGNPAGTAGYAKRLEAIQVVLVPKGSGAPSNNYNGVKSSQTLAYYSKY